jgi:hypothetical protein
MLGKAKYNKLLRTSQILGENGRNWKNYMKCLETDQEEITVEEC